MVRLISPSLDKSLHHRVSMLPCDVQTPQLNAAGLSTIDEQFSLYISENDESPTSAVPVNGKAKERKTVQHHYQSFDSFSSHYAEIRD
ncbi:MAG: hypothetical protein MUC66_00615 [Methanolinea sp.]|jgi:hypothetical protein|nr:hypothetical protein [Methanolinea sp.]